MRPISLGIFFCILLAGSAICVDKFAGMHLDLSAPLAAAGAAILASILAAMLLRMVRHAAQATVMQIGLLATLVHMSVLLISAAVILLGHMPVGPSFIYWLMGMYLITMAALIASITAAIRDAQPNPTITKA